MTKQLLVFGGPYSNLQATLRMKEIAETLGFTPDRIICTGDVVGYCAQPQETLDVIFDWGIHWIAGNVELQLSSGAEDCGCNFEEGSRCSNFSQTWFPYAQIHVDETSKQKLEELSPILKLTIDDTKIGVIHGGLEDVSQFIFKSTPSSVKSEIIEELDVDVLLAGHCGIPFHQTINKALWVNAGVIGMPANDGENHVWYAIVNLETKGVEHHSFTYNWQEAQAKMRAANLPEEYAKTLGTGLWDNMEILPETERQQRGQKLLF